MRPISAWACELRLMQTLSSRTRLELGIRGVPVHRLAGRQDFRPAFVLAAVEFFVEFGLFDRLGDGVEDEAVRGLPGTLCREGDAGFQRVVETDGDCWH